MYLRHLQYLRSVVEHGSFARAAQACGVSQPAISQGMKALQAHFPAPLLVRAGRRYVPTELARSVAAQSSSLGQRMGALGLEPLPATDRNVLRIGLTPSAALVWGHVLYARCCLSHPRRCLDMVGQSDLLAVVPHPALLGAATPLVKALQLTEALPLYGMWLFELRSRPSRIDPKWVVTDPSLPQSRR